MYVTRYADATTTDLTGLSVSAAIEVAARDFNREAVAVLLRIARSLSHDGLDRGAINAALERERVELEAWRKKSLADLRGWLERDGEALQ